MSESIQTLIPEHCKNATLADKVYFILNGLHKFAPTAFNQLEGFTRDEGRVVFVSRFPEKIRNSGHGFRALPLLDSDWFVNTSLSQTEAVRFFERICRAMAISIEAKRYIIYLVTPPMKKGKWAADTKFIPLPTEGIPPLLPPASPFPFSQSKQNCSAAFIQQRIPSHMKRVLGVAKAAELEIDASSKGVDVRFLIALHWKLFPQERAADIPINKLTSYVDSACFLLESGRSLDQLKIKIAVSLDSLIFLKNLPVTNSSSSNVKKVNSGHCNGFKGKHGDVYSLPPRKRSGGYTF